MKKTLKTLFALGMVVAILFTITACGSAPSNEPTPASQTPSEETASEAPETESTDPGTTPEEPTQEDTSAEEPAASADVLVAYFSATGTTKAVAERIASVTGGDLYEILPAEPYTAEDLNYHDKTSRSTTEQNDPAARPAISGEDLSLDGYTTIYLGFPIWWGEEPRILDTFVEQYNFDGITVIPFCTSGGSGIGRSGPNMEAHAGTGTWLEGKRFSSTVTEEELQSWVDSLQ